MLSFNDETDYKMNKFFLSAALAEKKNIVSIIFHHEIFEKYSKLSAVQITKRGFILPKHYTILFQSI